MTGGGAYGSMGLREPREPLGRRVSITRSLFKWFQGLAESRGERQTDCPVRPPTGRAEKRNARTMAVELSPLDASLPPETTVTENVSPHGARVVTKQRWRPEDRVLLKSVRGGLRLQGRVIYCQYLPSNTFAIGLDLFGPIREWGTPT